MLGPFTPPFKDVPLPARTSGSGIWSPVVSFSQVFLRWLRNQTF